MLKRLTRGARFWAAIVLIAGYVLCVLAPSVALAFSPTPCHADNHHASATAKAHHDAAAPDHGNMGGDGGPAGDDTAAVKCCELAFVTAIAPQTELNLSLPVEFARTALVMTRGLTGLSPERLNRPPKI